MKRREIKVRNNPGIYKVQVFNENTKAWTDSGKYRAIKRTVRDGESKKEQAFFTNIEDAKAFRAGEIVKTSGLGQHKTDLRSSPGMTFANLVEKWKQSHYLTIEDSTRQTYEKLLPTLDCLKPHRVDDINLQVINDLAIYWAKDFPRSWRRKSFVKEWQLLRVILNFYREEIPEGAMFVIPSFKKVRKMTEITPNVEGEIEFLSAEETTKFLAELKNERDSSYYRIALFQYYFALRVGEACGLCWDSIDTDKGITTIRRSVTWDLRSWVPTLKEYTKTKRVRHLPIPQPLIPVIEELRRQKEGALVFQREDGTPMNRKTIATVYNRALGRLKFDHVSGTHFLRRTAATLANEATSDYDAVSKFLGHTSIKVTRRYVGTTDFQKERISGALEDILKNVVDEPRSRLKIVK